MRQDRSDPLEVVAEGLIGFMEAEIELSRLRQQRYERAREMHAQIADAFAKAAEALRRPVDLEE